MWGGRKGAGSPPRFPENRGMETFPVVERDKGTLVSKAHLRGVCFLVFNTSQTGKRKDRKTIKRPLFNPMEGHLLRFEAVGKNMDWSI